MVYNLLSLSSAKSLESKLITFFYCDVASHCFTNYFVSLLSYKRTNLILKTQLLMNELIFNDFYISLCC